MQAANYFEAYAIWNKARNCIARCWTSTSSHSDVHIRLSKICKHQCTRSEFGLSWSRAASGHADVSSGRRHRPQPPLRPAVPRTWHTPLWHPRSTFIAPVSTICAFKLYLFLWRENFTWFYNTFLFVHCMALRSTFRNIFSLLFRPITQRMVIILKQ